jgi:hypothetical protein
MVRRASLALVAALAACNGGSPSIGDGGFDGLPFDSLPASVAGRSALAADFTVSRCPVLERLPRCIGGAPLTLQFTPISTGAVTRYLWDFGDGTPRSSEAVPTHTYTLPGSYDVTLVGGSAAGTVAKVHPGFVVVTANQAGETCEVDAQCQQGLTCVCGSAATCPPAFVRGLCAAPCGGDTCPAAQVCGDLSLSAAGASAPESWQRALCLRGCASDLDCAAGLRCRDLPGKGTAGWVRGCFPDYPGPIGRNCRATSGLLRPELCVTGTCADLGALGACSLDCTSASCPAGTGCLAFTDGRRLCLPTCSAAVRP